MYNEAADEFQKCREYRTALPNPMSRGVADAHVRRAQALFYASTLDGAEKVSRQSGAAIRLALRSRFYYLYYEPCFISFLCVLFSVRVVHFLESFCISDFPAKHMRYLATGVMLLLPATNGNNYRAAPHKRKWMSRRGGSFVSLICVTVIFRYSITTLHTFVGPSCVRPALMPLSWQRMVQSTVGSPRRSRLPVAS